ncbi:hypothetical protein SEVIR_8G231501v4 [Setaria viridis]
MATITTLPPALSYRQNKLTKQLAWRIHGAQVRGGSGPAGGDDRRPGAAAASRPDVDGLHLVDKVYCSGDLVMKNARFCFYMRRPTHGKKRLPLRIAADIFWWMLSSAARASDAPAGSGRPPKR